MERVEHETSLEHAAELADANAKEAKRLLEQGRKAHAAGDITDERLDALERLYETAVQDQGRTHREV